jgi:hypothetical protein
VLSRAYLPLATDTVNCTLPGQVIKRQAGAHCYLSGKPDIMINSYMLHMQLSCNTCATRQGAANCCMLKRTPL